MSSYILDSYIDALAQKEENRKRVEQERREHPEKSIFIRKIEQRTARNQDARIVITGEAGMGKSTLELRIGEIVNPEIYVDDINKAVEEATSFTAKQSMTGVRTLPSGTQLSFDEPGQAWYHRQFMSEASMILSKTMIGFRYKKFKSVLTIPNIDLLDVDALRLVQYMVNVTGQGRAEVFRVMVQKFGGPPWFKKIIDKLTFTKPDTKLWHLYETKKFKMQDELYEKFGKRLDDLDSPKLTNLEIIKIVTEAPKQFLKKGKIHVPYLQRDFGVGLNRGYLIKETIEGNGEDRAPVVTDTLQESGEPARDLLRKVMAESAE